MSSDCDYEKLSAKADTEGNEIGKYFNDITPYRLGGCMNLCYNNFKNPGKVGNGCQSFHYCPNLNSGSCVLFDLKFSTPQDLRLSNDYLDSDSDRNDKCHTVYGRCHTGIFASILS